MGNQTHGKTMHHYNIVWNCVCMPACLCLCHMRITNAHGSVYPYSFKLTILEIWWCYKIVTSQYGASLSTIFWEIKKKIKIMRNLCVSGHSWSWTFTQWFIYTAKHHTRVVIEISTFQVYFGLITLHQILLWIFAKSVFFS